MKRTIAALGGTLALATLAACGPADQTTEAATPTSSASSNYIDVVDEILPPTSSATLPTKSKDDIVEAALVGVLSDAGINCTPDDCVAAAHTVCQFLDEGNKIDDLFLELAYNKVMEIDTERIFHFTDNENVPSIVGASIAGFCPEYSYQIDN